MRWAFVLGIAFVGCEEPEKLPERKVPNADSLREAMLSAMADAEDTVEWDCRRGAGETDSSLLSGRKK